jgi:apolipoprotein N-acyltransferase
MKTLLPVVVSGVLFGLAFPNVGWAPLALLVWIPLLIKAPEWSWKRRFFAGWLTSFIAHMFLFRWIDFTLEMMTNLPGWVHPIGQALFSAWHAVLAGLFLALSEPMRDAFESKRAGTGAVAVAALYAALEWSFPFLFPWTFGQAFWEVSAWTSIMALTGVAGLTFWVLCVNTVAADYWLRRDKRSLFWGAGILLPMLIFGVFWSQNITATENVKSLRVAVIQPNYSVHEKRTVASGGIKSLEMRKVLLDRLLTQLRSLKKGEHDLVIGSEGAYPFLWELNAKALEKPRTIDAWATRKVTEAIREGSGAHTILGGLRNPSDGNNRFRNSAVHFDPNGRIMGHYDKRILVPFGEYMPGRDLFPSLAKGVQGVSNFGSGQQECRFEFDGHVASCGICYEALFDDLTRDGMGNATMLLNFTIDTWFGTTVAPPFHLMAQSSRAAELGVPFIRAALTGISTIVGPDGVVQEALDVNVQGILSATVHLPEITTPYRAIGPVFRWLCVLLVGWGMRISWRRRRRHFSALSQEENPAMPGSQDTTEATEPNNSNP